MISNNNPEVPFTNSRKVLDQWRLDALNWMLKVIFLVILVPVLILIAGYIIDGHFAIAIILALCTFTLLVLALSPRLEFRLRSVLAIGMFMLGTIVSSITHGMSAGFGISFVFTAILASIFHGYKCAIATCVALLLLTGATGLVISSGIGRFSPQTLDYLEFSRWPQGLIFTVSMSAIIVTLINYLLKSLLGNALQSEKLIEELRETLVLRDQEVLARRSLLEKMSRIETMESIGLIAGRFAHDICNNLAIIQGSVGLMQIDRSEDHLDDIELATTNAAVLARNLLALGRQDTSSLEPICLDEFIVKRMDIFRRIALDCNLTLNIQASGMRVMVDPSQLQQCMINVLGNANTAACEAGKKAIEIRIEEYKPARKEQALNGTILDHHNVAISVIDQGPGIPKEKQELVFEPFYSNKPPNEGSGLGLPSVKFFMETVGGKIDLDSGPDGTRFTLVFPALEPAMVLPKHQTGDFLANLRVLVVDNNSFQVLSSSRLLEEKKCVVTQATSGEEALNKCAPDSRFDLLCTDAVMPGLHGTQLARKFKELFPAAKVLLCTAHTESSILSEVINEPDYALLRKPFRAQELYDAITTLLSSEQNLDEQAL